MKRILYILLLFPLIDIAMEPVPLTPRDKKKAFKTLLKISKGLEKNERARAEEERKNHAKMMEKIALLGKEVTSLAVAETIMQDSLTTTASLDIPRSSPSSPRQNRERGKSIKREKCDRESDYDASSGEKK
jgi:hypothetical protein